MEQPRPAASPPSERTRVRRVPRRAAYDRATVEAILDEGLVCHLAFVADHQPYAIPTAYARIGEYLYVHGSTASRMLRAAAGSPVCATVTLLDGLVLARSAFHHSMNYRSVVVLGAAEEVSGEEERLAAMRALVERLAPGRWAEIRPPSPQELKATTILRLPLAESSAKIRTGPPVDDEEDLTLPCWAGVVPLALAAAPPLPDAGVTAPTPRSPRF
jgi:nitroimidazol reductase NimA-like FMN-containing flavoprotein (pyridoxamine 5'-phosphate oxidase superfamily)